MNENREAELTNLTAKFWTSVTLFDNILKTAKEWLQEDMEVSESYVPDRGRYHEKNQYFNGVNQLGLWILRSGIHTYFADQYYRVMLDTILAYEKEHKKHFNKGMVYANLGIAQIVQGKFDAGIAHLLTAEWEDREVAEPKQFILDTELWTVFETRTFDRYKQLNGLNWLAFVIDDSFLEQLVKGLSNQNRIFLGGTMLTLIDNVNQNRVQPNNFTYARIFSGMKDLCLLIETLLREQQRSKTKNYAPNSTIYNLLEFALSKQGIKFQQPSLKGLAKADKLEDFLNHYEEIMRKSTQFELRFSHCIHLIRNFTGHHFDVSDNVFSKSGKSFNDIFESALDYILAAFMYLKHINAI